MHKFDFSLLANVVAVLYFSRYRISTLTSGGISSRLLSTPRYVSMKTLVHWLIWPPDGHLKNHDFFFTVTILLSHLLQDHSWDFFETCLKCASSCLVVPVWINCRSVSKYGRCWLSLSHLETRRRILWKLCIWILLNPLMRLPKNDSSLSTNMATRQPS